jgi:hypothetical protein
MRISVILAHPDAGSFIHAIAGTGVGQLQANVREQRGRK